MRLDLFVLQVDGARGSLSVSTGQTLQTAASWFCMPRVSHNLEAVRHVYGCLASFVPPSLLFFSQLSCKPSPARSAAAAILATLLGGQASSAEESRQGQDLDSYPARTSNSEGEGLSYDGSSDDTSIKDNSNKSTMQTGARRDAWRRGGGDEPQGSVTANIDADTDAEAGVVFREWCLPFPPKGDENLGAAGGGRWGGGVEEAVHRDGSGGKSTTDGSAVQARGIRARRVGRGSPSGGSACVETPASAILRRSSPRYHGSPRARSANHCGDALDGDIAAAVPEAADGSTTEDVSGRVGWTPSPGWRGGRSGTGKLHAMAGEERQSAIEDGVASANSDAIDGGDAGGASGGDFLSCSEDLGDVPASESKVEYNRGSSSNARKRKYSRKDKVRDREFV